MFRLCELKDILLGEWLKTKRHYDQDMSIYSIPHKIWPVLKKVEIVLIFFLNFDS